MVIPYISGLLALQFCYLYFGLS